MKLRRIVPIIPGVAAISAFVLLMAAAVLLTIKTNDDVFLPAPAEAIDARIAIPGHPARAHRGSFYITFIYEEQQVNVLTELYQRFLNPDATIVSLRDYYGPTIPTAQQQQQQGIVDMISSKDAARLAAFSALGYHLRNKLVVIVGAVDPRSKAVGKLQPGDIIVAVNGHVIKDERQVQRIVRPLSVAAPVSLVIQRPVDQAMQTFTVTVPTIRLSGHVAIGIALQAAYIPARLPYKVTINTDNIEGPSAGLMFTLGIINRLSPLDLTHGHKIAGTGTIDANGNVGPIGGAKQKVIGAREAGAQYFFVPASENYGEARPYARGLTLVPVNTLADALHFLRRLR